MTTKSKKRNWDETISRLYREIPEAKNVDFGEIFRADPQILGSLINDIIKVDISEPGRPGKRSASSAEDIAADLRKLTNDDYSNEDFVIAMRTAMGTRSLRQVARDSGLDKMVVKRLLDGKGEPPTGDHMEALAKAFRKNASYFKEYRAAYICSAMYSALTSDGDRSIVLYNKIKGRT